MKLLVTGATGHLGGNIVRAGLASGHTIRALARDDRRALAGLEVEIVSGDVTDAAAMRRACEGVDGVIHAAARISIRYDDADEVFRTNVEGTRTVVEAAVGAKVKRLVHVSSIHAFRQEPRDAPIDETRPLVDPADLGYPPYDRSKAAADREVQNGSAAGLDAIVVHPSGIMGPEDWKPSHLGEVLLRLAHGRLPGLVRGGFDWVDARDVASVCLRLAERGAPSRRYLVSGRWASIGEIASKVAAITGRPAPRLVVPLSVAYAFLPCMAAWARLRGERPVHTRVALHALRGPREVRSDRARADLGFAPRPFERTIADTLLWFARAGLSVPGGFDRDLAGRVERAAA